MVKSLRDVAAEMFRTSEAQSVRMDYTTDAVILMRHDRSDLHISRNEIDDNIHHKIIEEWTRGKKAST